MKGWKDWMNYIMRGRDPTTAAVLAEDMGAVAGLGIACESRVQVGWSVRNDGLKGTMPAAMGEHAGAVRGWAFVCERLAGSGDPWEWWCGSMNLGDRGWAEGPRRYLLLGWLVIHRQGPWWC